MAAILQQETAFGSTTSPTSTQVEAAINAMEDHIDQETGHAWRTVTVSEEYHDLPIVWNRDEGARISLRHRSVADFTSETDLLEIWDGASWVDWVATKTEGRANDFWVDYTDGVIYINWAYGVHRTKAVRVTYRYGESSVPNDIKEACALLAAARILSADDRSNLLAETGDPTRMSHDSRATRWRDRAYRILESRKEFVTV